MRLFPDFQVIDFTGSLADHGVKFISDTRVAVNVPTQKSLWGFSNLVGQKVIEWAVPKPKVLFMAKIKNPGWWCMGQQNVDTSHVIPP
jgi:hypothetical protein